MVKFGSNKAKHHLLRMASFLKGTGYFINEDFSKEVLTITEENLEKVNKLRDKGKYAVLFYEKVISRERKFPDNIAYNC